MEPQHAIGTECLYTKKWRMLIGADGIWASVRSRIPGDHGLWGIAQGKKSDESGVPLGYKSGVAVNHQQKVLSAVKRLSVVPRKARPARFRPIERDGTHVRWKGWLNAEAVFIFRGMNLPADADKYSFRNTCLLKQIRYCVLALRISIAGYADKYRL